MPLAVVVVLLLPALSLLSSHRAQLQSKPNWSLSLDCRDSSAISLGSR